MDSLYKSWDTPRSRFGDLAVLGFLLVQYLDGMFTYLGVSTWGLAIEANPIISSAVAHAGLTAGLVSAKLLAITFGVILHLRRVHAVVALLTAFYLVMAIIPWAVLFFST